MVKPAAAGIESPKNCKIIPPATLDDMVRKRATQKARKDVSRVDHTMRLENQALLKSDLDAEEQRTIDLILSGSLRRLWDEDRDYNA